MREWSRAVFHRWLLPLALVLVALLPQQGAGAWARSPVDASRVQGILERAAQTFPGRAGMTFIDLGSQARASVRGASSFEAASLIKICILVELMEQVKAGSASLAETMTLRDDDKTGGSGTLRDRPAGTRVSLGTLAWSMITISDNTATDMLIRRVGMANVESRMQGLGLRHTHLRRRIMDFGAIDRGLDNVTSPDDMAALLALLARGKVVDAASCARMVDILTHQQRRHIIAAGVPKGVRVASKTGELNGIIHDVAIVYAPRGPYVLALLGAEVSDAEAARRAFREVSAAVYRACDP